MTEEQTRSIYETKTIGITDGVEKVDDIIETVNHFRCFDYKLCVSGSDDIDPLLVSFPFLHEV